MTTKEILLRAAEIIEERGWCQGQRFDSHGRVCLDGGIYVASKGLGFDSYSEVRDYLGKSPIQWNDAPERKAHHVTLALRATAYNLPEGA